MIIGLAIAASVALTGPAWAQAVAQSAGQQAVTPIGPQPVETLPGWKDDDLAGLAQAIARQCALPSPPVPWPSLCADMPSPPAAQPARSTPSTSTSDRHEALRRWIAERFVAWPLSAGGNRDGLITGYYEPELTGSRQRDRDGQVALYRRPDDLLRVDVTPQGESHAPRQTPLRGRLIRERLVVPYFSRIEIERRQLLAGQELLWLDDPVEAFFLQIQGAGRVRLRDGSVVRVGFADHNGRGYKAIGTTLIERGELTAANVSAQTIKAWLRQHPEQASEVMQTNPRYIFFRELPAPAGSADPDPAGPPGSLGVPLTALRSVATDPTRIPPGGLLFIDTTAPASDTPMRRVMVSQDTGAAIVGTVRADIFWGTGEAAGHQAGLMQSPARLWLLWPRDAPLPAALER